MSAAGYLRRHTIRATADREALQQRGARADRAAWLMGARARVGSDPFAPVLPFDPQPPRHLCSFLPFRVALGRSARFGYPHGFPVDLDAEEKTRMTTDAYKALLDAMPVDDVQRRIERLEQKLSDLHVLARLHAERQPAGSEAAPGPTGQETWSQATDAEASSEPAVEEASPESGSQPT